MRVEGPAKVGKHIFVLKPVSMDMQFFPDVSSAIWKQEQANLTTELSQDWAGIAKAMRWKVESKNGKFL